MRKRTRTQDARFVNFSLDHDKPLTMERLIRDVDTESIYYIRVQNLIKIGYTSRLINRLYQYGPGSFQRLLHVEPGTRADEAAIHKRWTPFRAYGREYYLPVPHLLRHIDERRAVLYNLPPLDWATVERRAV